MRLIKYLSKEFGTVRAGLLNGKVYFEGFDVSKALGHSSLSLNVKREDMAIVYAEVDNCGFNRIVINLSGVYRLIHTSPLANAAKFDRWVANKVIPDLLNHEFERAENTLEALMDKVDGYENFSLKRLKVYTTSQIAEEYGMSAQQLNRFLEEVGVQYKENDGWHLKSEYDGCGYKFSIENTLAYGKSFINRCWTQNGRFLIYLKLKENGIIPIKECEVKANE